MASANYSGFGLINGAGDDRANYEKIATGEILAAFTQTTEFMDKHMVRSIPKGKSAEFMVTGRKDDADYHVAGTQLLGGDFLQAPRVITIDGVLATDHFVADIDEAMTTYDIRSEITKQMGEELGQKFDRNVAKMIIKAARSSATVTGGDGGSALIESTFLTDSNKMAEAFFGAAAILDEKYVPAGERFGALKPVQYYALAQNTKVINKDWDGRGSYAEGSVIKIADIVLVKSNNVPTTDVTAGLSKYQGDFSTTAGVIWHKGAAGTVKLVDVAFGTEDMLSRLGTLMVARNAIGHDYLRPECAVELKTA